MADFGKTLVNFGKEVLFDSLPEAVPVLKGRKDLEYPLNNPDDYKGRLMFSIFEEEPLDMAALVGLSGIFAKDSDTSEITNDGEQTEEFKGEGVAYQTKEGSGSKLSQIDKSVKLFTPVALQFRDNVAYDNADLGFGGGIGVINNCSGFGDCFNIYFKERYYKKFQDIVNKYYIYTIMYTQINTKMKIYISNSLLFMFFLVAAMIVIGGLTRLTDSGLSITEWEFFKGFFPPMNKDSWLSYFELYKQIPEFKLQNYSMTLSEFKVIFWWEWAHRFFGRVIGLVFLVPLILQF